MSDVGKIGKESAAARFAAATPANEFSIQEEKPYAEVCSAALALVPYLPGRIS